MSSRVQKGNTVFRPVTKARSRPPTTSVGQPASTPPEPIPVPDVTSALSSVSSVPPPIPSTALPGRESFKPVPPIPVRSAPTLNEHQRIPTEPQEYAGEFSIPPVPRTRLAPALANASNLPPTVITVGRRSAAEQPTVINAPTRHDARPPGVAPQVSRATTPGIPTIPSGQNPQLALPQVPSLPGYSATTAPLAENAPIQHTVFQSLPAPPLQNGFEERPPLKRRRKSKTVSEDDDRESSPTKGSKSRSATPRHRRSRGPSLPPYDLNADPGEEVDPTTVTMASLCTDTGLGRVSSKAAEIVSNHAAWKARNREKRARMKVMMEAKKYGRTTEDLERREDESGAPVTTEEQSSSGVGPSAGPSTTGGAEDENGFDYSQQMATSKFNVQVRIGPNGETIIDEDSLVVDRAENEDTSHYTHVVESDTTKFVNSGTYAKRYRGSRWSAEETELFYHALAQYGENYELIAYVLPGRDRKACKNKFKAEDKKNHARINYCLNNRIPVDMKTLERMTGKDFSGPVPEIRGPPAPAIVRPDPSHSIGNNPQDSHQQTPALKPSVKKRSRSRTAGVEDGVTIVGSIDSVLPS